MTTSDLLSSIDSEISRLEQARKLLAAYGAPPRGGSVSPGKPATRKRTMSAEARERIAAAQRKRWAEQKKAAK